MADGSLLLDQGGVNTQNAAFDRVGVAANASQVYVGGAGQVGDQLGNQSAGTAFGGGNCNFFVKNSLKCLEI